MKNQSIIAYGKPLEATDSAKPEPQGTEVLLQVTHCGVCHSDVHIQDGYFELGDEQKLDITAGRKLPFTLGHEIEGKVAAVGSEVKSAKVGEDYVAYPWIGCGSCAICQRDEEHLCNAGQALGITKPGGFSDYVIVPHERYLIDYSGIRPGLAATYMCSGITAYSALNKIHKATPEAQVLIIGLGGVGMMGLQFARQMFAKPPLAADIDENKLQAAKGAGAAEVFNTKDSKAMAKLHKMTQGGVQGAVDFVGAGASFEFGNQSLRKGGKLVVVGLFGGGFAMPIPMLPLRCVEIGGSFVGSLQETHDMMQLIKAGKIDAIPVEERPLSAANKTLEDLRQGKVLGRVALVP